MHNNLEQQNNDRISENVLNKIRAGEVRMQPRIYFTLKMILLVVFAFFALVFSSLIISYILFSIRASGELFLLGFGFKGVGIFFELFPWFYLLIDILLLIVLEWLIKHFKFGYRHSIISLIFGLGLFTIFIALLIDVTPVHNLLLRRAERKQLPVIGSMYDHLRRPPKQDGVCGGRVVSVSGNEFVVEHDAMLDNDTDDRRCLVVAPSDVTLSTFLHIGDTVYAAGKLDSNGELHAFGITKVTMPVDLEDATTTATTTIQ